MIILIMLENVDTVRFHALQGCLMYNESVTI